MRMTIEDCIKELLINKEDDTYVLGNETIDFAIDTMRKYQKIEEIVNSDPEYIHHTDMNTYKVNSIREVVKDGKID